MLDRPTSFAARLRATWPAVDSPNPAIASMLQVLDETSNRAEERLRERRAQSGRSRLAVAGSRIAS